MPARTLEEMTAQGEELLKQPIDRGPPAYACGTCGEHVHGKYYEQHGIGFRSCEHCGADLDEKDRIEL